MVDVENGDDAPGGVGMMEVVTWRWWLWWEENGGDDGHGGTGM